MWKRTIVNKLLIIDGSNLLFQRFFGMPTRIINKDGKAIQGTLGFVGALLKIIRMTEPTHIVVLFAGEHENDRAELESDYKANRVDYSETPEDETPFLLFFSKKQAHKEGSLYGDRPCAPVLYFLFISVYAVMPPQSSP